MHHVILALSFLCISSGCTYRYLNFTYELRVPDDGMALPSKPKINVVTKKSAYGRTMDVRRDGDFMIYAAELSLPSGHAPYGVTVELPDKPAQVFLLPFEELRLTRWTDWAGPSYTEESINGSSAGFTFIYGVDMPRNRDIPADSFELRYKLSK